MHIHPVRAAIALAATLGTIYFIIAGISISEAWWGVLGVVVAFYFTNQ